MGNSVNSSTRIGKKRKVCEMREVSEVFEVNDNNGLVFFEEHYIPEELVSLIMSFLPVQDIVFNCRRVCKAWCNVIDTQVLRLMCHRTDIPQGKLHLLPWHVLYWCLAKSPLNRNLVKNGCGEDGLNHWTLVNGGDGWKVESPPVGCDELPRAILDTSGHNSCFVTSFSNCIKDQLVDLEAEGASEFFMEIVKPEITVTDWVAGRHDCEAVYELTIRLLDADQCMVGIVELTANVGIGLGTNWNKMTHTFREYEGVRFVHVQQRGKDSQFWKGHYGSKMTATSVYLRCPTSGHK